jgi:hypothetical protein
MLSFALFDDLTLLIWIGEMFSAEMSCLLGLAWRTKMFSHGWVGKVSADCGNRSSPSL